jgi:TolA-binding protein
MIAFRFISAHMPGMVRGLRRLALGFCALLTASAMLAANASAQQIESGPSAGESLAQRVFALSDRQQFSEVELLLATLAESHPASKARVAAVLYASERTYAQGHRPQAAAWLKPLARACPEPFQAAVNDALAWCQIDPRDLQVPAARLLELTEAHSASSFAPVALQLRAEKLAAAQRPDEAIFVYHAVLAQFPHSRLTPANLLAVARLHHDLDQQREAWDYLQRLVTDHPQANQTDAALYLGVQVAQRLDNDEATQEWLQKLVAEHEESPYWPDAALRLAEQRLDAGDRDAAKLLATRLLSKAEVRRQRSEVRSRKSAGGRGEVEGSQDVAVRGRFLLMRLAAAESDWTVVESRSQEILADQPGEPVITLTRFWHAEAAYRRGEQDLAFTRFLDLSLAIEGRTEAWLAVVPLRLALIEAQRQRWSTALEWADLAAQGHPQYSRLYEIDYVRGCSLAGLARFDEAREALSRVTGSAASAKTETAAMAQWLVGETWFQQHQYERAIAAYEQTLAGDFPQWQAAALLQAAKCCEQLGRWNDAAQRYEQLLRDHGDTRYVAAARSRLEKTQAKVAAQTMSETTTR